ncbi:MAG: hypothetical protein ACKOI2_11050 [Actinomycetota bacterium]
MNHTDFREDVIGGLVRHGGRLVSTEAFPWDPRDPDCDNDFHPGFRTQVDFPHWIVFLSSDGDPDWNDSDDYSVTFTLGAYFQHILDTSFESVRDSMVQELGNEWILEMAGDGVPGCWLERTLDGGQRNDVRGLVDEFVELCTSVHDRLGAWPNVPRIERLD